MLDATSSYSSLVREKKIIYVPTCILLESMATIHSHLSRLSNNRAVGEDTLEFTDFLLKRLLSDIQSTAKTYMLNDVKMFIGDWYADRHKAASLFRCLLLKAEWIHHRAIGFYGREIQTTIWALKRDWERLFQLLDGKNLFGIEPKHVAKIRYFHSADANNWLTAMAKTIIYLDEETTYDSPEVHLMLLCYARIKTQVVRKIHELQNRNQVRNKFNENRLLCVMHHDIPLTCPKCLKFTDDAVRETRSFPPFALRR